MSTGPGNARVERPRIQVVVRGDGYAATRAKANNIFRSLDGFRTRTINGTTYHWMQAVQSPFQMEPDANNRVRIGFNLDIMKALSTSSST